MGRHRIHVVKRNGTVVPLDTNKITDRIEALCEGLDDSIDPTRIMLDTTRSIVDGISTREIDEISAREAQYKALIHPDYGRLAARLLISNLHKSTPHSFTECMNNLYMAGYQFAPKYMEFINANAKIIDSMIIHSNDFLYNYNGVITLFNAYLHKVAGVLHDRPQYMLMRVAVMLWAFPEAQTCTDGKTLPPTDPLVSIKECYKVLSRQLATHGTPTLFNACQNLQNCVSCFLLKVHDSLQGIEKSGFDSALISKYAGGIGKSLSSVRPANSLIRGTRGATSGITSLLQIDNARMRKWNQGGRRNGSECVYIHMCHGDIMEFLRAGLKTGATEERARDLFYAIWVEDLFMKKVAADASWNLFDDSTAPGLNIVYDGMPVCTHCGFCDNISYLRFLHYQEMTAQNALVAGDTEAILPDRIYDPASYSMSTADQFTARIRMASADAICDRDCLDVDPAVLYAKYSHCTHEFSSRDMFTELYEKYSAEGRQIATVRAREIEQAIYKMRREAGMPFCCNKDTVNRLSNQANYGTVECSNLCTEIMQVSRPDSYACCTIGSISLPAHLLNTRGNTPETCYDFKALYKTVRAMARNLDMILDINVYPLPECRRNALETRAIGIGVQGLADVFAALRIPFTSPLAEEIDLLIFETLYFAALSESCSRAKHLGRYPWYEGSPASRGLLQMDMWAAEMQRRGQFRGRNFRRIWDWPRLRAKITQHGLRNSLLIALMPTVSTSQILGNNESFEPFEYNIYTKSTLHGKLTVTNKWMIRHLTELGIWSEDICQQIMNNDGSCADIEAIPASIREIYKTVYEIPQLHLMTRAAIRQQYVDQAQSLNLYMTDNSDAKLGPAFVRGWSLGLKTSQYYIRTRITATAPKNNIAPRGNVGNLPTDNSSAHIAPNVDRNDVCGSGGCSA